jgi:hypothetical protein
MATTAPMLTPDESLSHDEDQHYLIIRNPLPA